MRLRPSLMVATALGLAAIVSAASATEANREARQRTAQSGFAPIEEEYLTEAAAGETDTAIKLARFYMAHGLYVEALARLRGIESAEALNLSAECDFAMGRDRAVVERLAKNHEDSPLRAMSLSRLGAYDEAHTAFAGLAADAAPRAILTEFYLLDAEAAAAAGDADAARAALKQAAASGAALEATRAHFIEARIAEARGDENLKQRFDARAADGTNEWAMRARIRNLAAAKDAAGLEALSLERSGGAFERELNAARAKALLAAGNFDGGFAAARKVVDRFAQSDDALAAQQAISDALPRLFDEKSNLHPKEAARLFFENVEFAPPGRDGDRLIQDAAMRLRALGLYKQAAQLLDHQVSKRLRGRDRALVAADLAELYLLAKAPDEALRAIRTTRIAGLGAADNERRRLIEARALADGGRTDAAVAFLANAQSADDLLLRAEINWARRAWPEAARDYASYVASIASLTARRDRTAAVRAATAFLLAGDRPGYRSFAAEAEPRLGASAEADLIRSLGDVDQGQFMSKIMTSYRAVYDDKD